MKLKVSRESTFLFWGIFITAGIQVIAFGCQLNHAVFPFLGNNVDDRSLEYATSTEFRYQDKFVKTLSSYTDFRRMYQQEMSTAIPGLEYTSLGNTGTVQMVPQGICIAGDYMLITAYDKEKEHNSVIYVLMNNAEAKRELLTTIILPDKNHVGGITFDGEHIWIAKSVSGYCSAISYEILLDAVFSDEKYYMLSNYTENVYCGVTASFVTYYKERLWIGTYQRTGRGMLSCFRIVKGAARTYAKKESSIEIPSYAQGVSFLEIMGRTYMILTTSSGRYRDSEIYLYEMLLENGGVLVEKGAYNFPPMAEELVSDGQNTYFLFESAATCYSTQRYKKCAYPVDRICAVSNEKLLMEVSDVNFE